MGWVLRWKKAKGPPALEPPAEKASGCLRAETATELMSTPRRQKLEPCRAIRFSRIYIRFT
jgi:hypothetical protein